MKIATYLVAATWLVVGIVLVASIMVPKLNALLESMAF
jgi:hypothetical protein